MVHNPDYIHLFEFPVPVFLLSSPTNVNKKNSCTNVCSIFFNSGFVLTYCPPVFKYFQLLQAKRIINYLNIKLYSLYLYKRLYRKYT
jgi:hypothetical protein